MRILYLAFRVPYFFFKKFKRNVNYLINKYFFAITKNEIISSLEKIGLKEEMTVYAHSSMSSFGYVQGGPNAVIDSILDIIKGNGTLIMPTFTHRVNIFDPETTKSWTGAISEALKARKNSFRSIHPSHSVVALGPLAKEITKNHEKSRAPFDENSPFKRVIRKNSHILMLGTENNSMIHYVQNKINFPNLFFKRGYKIKCKINGYIKEVKTKLHHPIGSIKYIHKGRVCSDVEFLVKMYKTLKFEEKGYMKTIKIGKAVCHLIKMEDFIREAEEYLKKNIQKYKNEYSSIIK